MFILYALAGGWCLPILATPLFPSFALPSHLCCFTRTCFFPLCSFFLGGGTFCSLHLELLPTSLPPSTSIQWPLQNLLLGQGPFSAMYLISKPFVKPFSIVLFTLHPILLTFGWSKGSITCLFSTMPATLLALNKCITIILPLWECWSNNNSDWFVCLHSNI